MKTQQSTSIFTPKNLQRFWQSLLSALLLLVACQLKAQSQTPPANNNIDLPAVQDFYDTGTDQAVFDQAQQRLNLNPDTLQISQIEPVQWPDGCLGLPGICTQALVPGWRVTLSDTGNSWIFHTAPKQAVLNPISTFFPDPIQPPIACTAIWPSNCIIGDPIIGLTQDNPFLPTRRIDNGWLIEDMPSGAWGDPPMTPGFHYTMVSDSLFSSILDFPTGIDSDNRFTVSVGDQTLGAFGPGQSVDFQALLGAAVSEFTISGIDPLVDSEDPTAFPLRLAFTTPTASFRMDPLPEPQGVPEPGLLLGMGAVAALSLRIRHR
jgi:hypothetical protein